MCRDQQRAVTKFFSQYANTFDSLYDVERKTFFQACVNRFARKSMYRRFEVAFDLFRGREIRTLLDVGCGPGNHDVILAKKLGVEIVGIDVATTMIELARNRADEHHVAEHCTFVVQDFMDFNKNKVFDGVLSVGVVEYLMEPENFISKMVSHCSGLVIFSIPVKWHWLTPQRMLRYRIRKCPLKFYSKRMIIDLIGRIGITHYQILNINRDYLVVIDASKGQKRAG